MDRIAELSALLQQHPDNAFARYGLAMEHSRAGNTEDALAEFAILLEKHPDYSAGYFMAAQTLSKAGRAEEAKAFLRNGISAAARECNQHTQDEMQAMLDDLELSV